MASASRRLAFASIAVVSLLLASQGPASAQDAPPDSGSEVVLPSGLTADEAYELSVKMLASSEAELARAQSRRGVAGEADLASADVAAAASTSWPSYFSTSGLEPLACVFVIANLTACNAAKNYAQTALNTAQARYPSSVHNGKGDAFRHCYWNALMTMGIGEDYALRIASNHEAVSSNPTAEKNMDLYNNSRGRWAWKNYHAADTPCTQLLSVSKSSGGLQTSL